MPSQISRHHKKPILRAFSVYTFQSSFKKSISATADKTRQPFLTLPVRMFNGSSVSFVSFASLLRSSLFIRVCLSLTRQSPLHSPGTSCHARFAHTHSLTHSFRSSVHSCLPVAHAPVTATLAWHYRVMLASLAFMHFIAQFIRFAASFAHSFHSFHVRPLSHAFRICQGSLLATSTIRVASQWDKWNCNHFWLLVNKFQKTHLR